MEALIDAIGEVTAESGDAIDAARKAYDALTDGQKALVSNYETLTAAEEAYAALDEEPPVFRESILCIARRRSAGSPGG